jgi:rhodanese-related sulfurtransferase
MMSAIDLTKDILHPRMDEGACVYAEGGTMSKKHARSKTALSSKSKKTSRKQTFPWLWVGLGVAIVALAAFMLVKPKNTLPAEISATQAYQEYQRGAFFLDVRSQSEWEQAHIANTTLIPLDELPGRLSELPRDRDIVVVCRSGKRAKEGMTILRQAGFSRATCLTGGLEAWKAAGYPLEGSVL